MVDGDHSENPTGSVPEALFMQLFIQHEPMLRAYARSLLPTWDRVDEVMQEASVVLWQKLDQLQHVDGFAPWSRVVVRLKCLESIAALRREQKVFSEGVVELLIAESEEMDSDLREGQRRCVRRCLDEFSPPHRELLLAPYSGHGRIGELATARGKSPNALYKLLRRLRDKLEVCVRSRLSSEGLVHDS